MLEQPFYFFAAAFFAATTYIGLDVAFTFTTVFCLSKFHNQQFQ